MAYHLLGVGPEEMLDAQARSSRLWPPSPLRVRRSRVDLLEELVDQSGWWLTNLMSSISSRLRSTTQSPRPPGTGRCKATLASLGQVQSSLYRDRGSPQSARAAVGIRVAVIL